MCVSSSKTTITCLMICNSVALDTDFSFIVVWFRLKVIMDLNLGSHSHSLLSALQRWSEIQFHMMQLFQLKFHIKVERIRIYYSSLVLLWLLIEKSNKDDNFWGCKHDRKNRCWVLVGEIMHRVCILTQKNGEVPSLRVEAMKSRIQIRKILKESKVHWNEFPYALRGFMCRFSGFTFSLDVRFVHVFIWNHKKQLTRNKNTFKVVYDDRE